MGRICFWFRIPSNFVLKPYPLISSHSGGCKSFPHSLKGCGGEGLGDDFIDSPSDSAFDGAILVLLSQNYWLKLIVSSDLVPWCGGGHQANIIRWSNRGSSGLSPVEGSETPTSRLLAWPHIVTGKIIIFVGFLCLLETVKKHFRKFKCWVKIFSL